jgi:hypothetical protein
MPWPQKHVVEGERLAYSPRTAERWREFVNHQAKLL